MNSKKNPSNKSLKNWRTNNMKILDLKLQAFGPFLNEQHIPFSLLNDKGMFLINGPTGTGKTSIFDAIVYALYGKGSGKDRDDGKSLRSDFAKEDMETYVDLTFEANGQRYRVVRKPSYQRKKNRGEGYTSTNPVAELYLPGDIVISKPKEVDDKIINDILFIDRDQFKNIALLAQGEFTELVIASSRDRAKILEHIFQKEIYEKFQDKIIELFKDADRQKGEKISALNTLIAQVEDGETILGYQEALQEPSNVPDFIANLMEYISKLSEEEKTKKEVVDNLRKVYEESFKKLESLKQNNTQVEKYLKAKAEQEELLKRKDEIEELKKKVDIQQEVDGLSPFFSQLENLKKELDDYQKQIDGLKAESQRILEESKWLEENKEKYESTKKEIETLSLVVNDLKKVISQIGVLNNEKQLIQQKEGVFATNFKDFQEKERKFLELRNRFFASFSYNLAQELKDGKPCPVCGSTSHPHPAESSNPVDEVTYKQEENRYNTLKENIEKQRSDLSNMKSAFQVKIDGFINTLKESGYPEADRDFIFNGVVNTIFEEKDKELIKLKKFISDFEERNKKLSSDKAKLEEKTNGLNGLVKTTKEKIEGVEKSINDKFTFNQVLKTLETYLEFSKNKIDAKKAKEEIDRYNQKLIVADTIIKGTSKELIEAGSVDLSALVEATNEKDNAYKEAQTQLNSLDNKIKNLNKNADAINKVYLDCKDLIFKYSSLSELMRTATGKNRLNLNFKMYILADYFDKIIIQANKRLYKITNGRYRLVRRNDVKGGGLQGLDLNVFDLETGKDRPASSLSGGEKFVSALSMALGLSDIIETNHALIQMESIFIDEGFGSLDENYLDMAMKALESLKEDNKTVAIISHVEKLKEYIPDGLEVNKDKVGSKVTLKQNI